jgi:hypothetical protein
MIIFEYIGYKLVLQFLNIEAHIVDNLALPNIEI